MRSDLIIDLAECSEFRQALGTRAPRIVHGTAILLVALLAAALSWMALTKANLVVRAPGRVRPVTDPEDTFDHFSDEISCEFGGRVVELNVDEGDEIGLGDDLLRLDTRRVENQIAQLKRTIEAEKEELEKLEHYGRLLTRQFESSEEEAQAELAEAEDALRLQKQQQTSDIRLAQLQLAEAEDKEARTRKLATRGAATEQELVEARTGAGEAREKLRRAQLPLDQGKLEVLRHALECVEREYEVQRKDLEIKRRAKQGKVEADQFQLANLELERGQAVVRAPAGGIITKVEVKVGDIVEPGKVGITMARQRGLEFEVTVANADVAHLRAGMPTKIKLDAYDYQKYGTLDGTVRFVSPDSQLLEGAEGQQAALYKVKIALAGEELGRREHRGRVKLGMTGQAEIVTDSESMLMLLVRKIRQSISLG